MRTAPSLVRDLLACAGCEDGALLLAHVLGRHRAWLFAHDDWSVDPMLCERFEALCERRRSGEPFAYLVGRVGFFGREFLVDRRVLIPRPQTEHLVEEALAYLQRRQNAQVADVGTGSGAIACTIAAEVSDATVDATDICAQALELAWENGARLGVNDRVCFHLGDVLEPLRGQRYDAILANLPYVPSAGVDASEPSDGLRFEPRAALDGGGDGLAIYRRLLQGAPAALKPGGLLVMEAAPPTLDALAELARAAFSTAAIAVGYDYGGRARLVKVKTPG
jgi:release factor glutamine methyltransferase